MSQGNFICERGEVIVPAAEVQRFDPGFILESYVNKNHSNDFIGYYGEDGPGVQKPTGKGERFIIMDNASSHNALAVYSAPSLRAQKRRYAHGLKSIKCLVGMIA